MTTTNMKIEGMHCDACVQRVKGALEREAGVKKAVVSLERGEAGVEYDERAVTADRLREVIARAGYTAREAA